MNFNQVVEYLESLQMMPKTMPGLDKIRSALTQTDWYADIDPSKIIVVAGTNGKGSTCAALQALLLEAKQKVGFYSSPHLISTCERIQVNGKPISEEDFVKLFLQCKKLIDNFKLSHFEALTLMAAQFFFDEGWGAKLDFVIFEVGLGGAFDATNAFPHKYCMITKLGLDHTNILGNSLVEIAENKFGIVGNKNIVVHHELPTEVLATKSAFQKKSNSNWVETERAEFFIDRSEAVPKYTLKYAGLKIQINLAGKRAAENVMAAVTMFQILGFDLHECFGALNKINWPGRMQKIEYRSMTAPLFLSGDHNEQGVESLLEILKDFHWKTLHLIVGIGTDKNAEAMLCKLCKLENMKLYLTETPFKGKRIADYPEVYLKRAEAADGNIKNILDVISAKARPQDLVLVTGSLYLVGKVLNLK